MNEATQRASAWIYRGLWAVLVEWFRVPAEPPTLPVQAGGPIESFGPSPDFLRYLKFWFWLGLLPLDLVILIAWVAITVAYPPAGFLLAVPAFALAVLPDIVVYIALHLRFDTTRYVMTDRSLRIRRGIWVIQEVTITYENIQNVEVRQGPLQRYYGIADVIIETAGGGGNPSQPGSQSGHRGVIEGIADPDRIRETLLGRLRHSRTAGLGDDLHELAAVPNRWSAQHVAVLREIRDEVAAMKPGF
ncbi:MAG TPA: PH domain-containing protein [Phycisphaerae bacterium]|nr:PH domain-containing protein [Phycisphaerae bacterium]HRY66629.1 PH domain-containing protein [Phycisphaerae bacterium]HSA29086.1 PH domain-containing protein [Phycisphaerae bacterium]